MGLVFRGMLGVTVSQILSNHSIVTVKMEEKQPKPPDISLKASKSFSPQMDKKNPRLHLLTFDYY